MSDYINPEEPIYQVTQGYGTNPNNGVNPAGGHTGRDKGTPVGSKFYSPCDGVVVFEGFPQTMDGSDNPWLLTKGGGLCLVIDSADGKYAFPAGHLNATHVSVGDRVTKGQHVADTGNTGLWTTGPHVHTECMPDRWNIHNGTYGRINPDLVMKGFHTDVNAQPSAPNQRKNGPQVTLQRSTPEALADGSNVVREIPAGQIEVFEGYVHGQELTINGVTTDIWYKDHIGYAWAGLFTQADGAGLPDLTPRPQLAANQRRVGEYGVKARVKPEVDGSNPGDVGSNISRVIAAGEVEVLLGYITNGQNVDGNAIWYVNDREYLWSGGFESQDLVGLPDLTVVTPPPVPAPPVPEVDFRYLSGIDVSVYQESAALNTLPGDFYGIKATEGGGDWSDKALASNVAEARLTGKPVIFYHYARPMVTEGNTAAEEARSFLAAIKPHLQKGDRVALDWEAENQHLTEWAEEWLDRVADGTESKPFIYLNAAAINGPKEAPHDWSRVEQKYQLWYAGGRRYGDVIEQFLPIPVEESQTTWAAGIALWQYTSRGRLRGYEGDLDLNICYLTMDEFLAGGAAGALEEPAPNPPLVEPAPPLTNDPDDSLREFADWLFESFKNRNKE